jgi:reverse transcriptase-like protein
MSKDLYPKLCRPETLRIAVNYVFDDQKDDFVPDVFRHQDYIYNLDENLARLARNLAHGTYRPRPLREIDVPKTGLSVRPGSSLEIEDHIVFFGIAYLLAPVLDRVLPDSVFHFRVRKKGDRPHPRQLFLNEHRPLLARHLRKRLRIFGDWYEVWPEFMAEAQKLYAEKGFNFLVESDISAFFENISHPLLADVLRQHAPHQLRLINVLMEMISTWATPSFWGIRPQRGIPQGNEVSSWLGTLFLVQMDVELLKLQRRGLIEFVRYVDDLKVFAKDRKTARKVVLLINQLLRRMHLNMQTSKTDIFEGEEIARRLRDERVEKVTQILDTLPEADDKTTEEQKQAAIGAVKPVFDEHFATAGTLQKTDIRLFKRVLTVLKAVRSPIAVEFCLKCIWDQPALTEKIAKYLASWMARQDVQQSVSEAVFGDGELFDTQYLSLIPLLRQSETLTVKHRSKLLKIGRGELHWAARAEALLTLMLLPLEEQHFRQLRKLYNRESSPYVKKVILALFLKAPLKIKQPVFKETITEPEEETNRFRKFIWSLGNSSEHCKPALKTIGKIEHDPARLLVSLHGALQSRDMNVLRQVKNIADTQAKEAKAKLSRQSFTEIAKSAEQKLAALNKPSAS